MVLKDVDSSRREAKPLLLEFRSSNTFILVTICLAVFTDGFLYAVIVPVLPFSLRERSGIPEDQIQRWTSCLLTVFGASTLVASPFAGWLADNTPSRRVPFLIGLALQAASTALFLVSLQVGVLFVARALQGLSSAVVYSVGLAMLVDTVGVDQIGRQAGYFLSSANFGVLISPMLGGYVYANAGYDAVVYMMVALVTVDILLRIIMIEKKEALKWEAKIPALDDEQPISMRREERDYGTITRIGTGGGETQPLLSDPRISHNHTTRNLPAFLRLLISPRALSSLLAVAVGYTIPASFDASLAVFVKEKFHWTSTSAGLIFLAIALPSLLSPLAGYCCDRFGPRWIVVFGFMASACGLFAVGFISEPEVWQEVGLCGLLVLIGTGIAFVFPCLAADLTAVAEDMAGKEPDGNAGTGSYAQAFALFNCGIATGTALGPLWMGIAVPDWGWRTATLMLGGLALLACVPVLLFHGGEDLAGAKTGAVNGSVGRTRDKNQEKKEKDVQQRLQNAEQAVRAH